MFAMKIHFLIKNLIKIKVIWLTMDVKIRITWLYTYINTILIYHLKNVIRSIMAILTFIFKTMYLLSFVLNKYFQNKNMNLENLYKRDYKDYNS